MANFTENLNVSEVLKYLSYADKLALGGRGEKAVSSVISYADKIASGLGETAVSSVIGGAAQLAVSADEKLGGYGKAAVQYVSSAMPSSPKVTTTLTPEEIAFDQEANKKREAFLEVHNVTGVKFADILALDPEQKNQKIPGMLNGILGSTAISPLIVKEAHKLNAQITLERKALDPSRSRSSSTSTMSSSTSSVLDAHKEELAQQHLLKLEELANSYANEKNQFSKQVNMNFEEAVAARLKDELLAKKSITKTDLENVLRQENELNKEIFRYEDIASKVDTTNKDIVALLKNKQELDEMAAGAQASKDKFQSHYLEMDYRAKKAAFEESKSKLTGKDLDKIEKEFNTAKTIFLSDREKNPAVSAKLVDFNDLLNDSIANRKDLNNKDLGTAARKAAKDALTLSENKITVFLRDAKNNGELILEDIDKHFADRIKQCTTSKPGSLYGTTTIIDEATKHALEDVQKTILLDGFKDKAADAAKERDDAKNLLTLIDTIGKKAPVKTSETIKSENEALKLYNKYADKIRKAEIDAGSSVSSIEAIVREREKAVEAAKEAEKKAAVDEHQQIYEDKNALQNRDLKLIRNFRAVKRGVRGVVGLGHSAGGVVATTLERVVVAPVAVRGKQAALGLGVVVAGTVSGVGYTLAKLTQGASRFMTARYDNSPARSDAAKILITEARILEKRIDGIETKIEKAIENIPNLQDREQFRKDFESFKKTELFDPSSSDGILNSVKNVVLDKKRRVNLKNYTEKAAILIDNLQSSDAKTIKADLDDFIEENKAFSSNVKNNLDKFGGFVERQRNRRAADQLIDNAALELLNIAKRPLEMMYESAEANKFELRMDGAELLQKVQDVKGKVQEIEIPANTGIKLENKSGMLNLMVTDPGDKTQKSVEITKELLIETLDSTKKDAIYQAVLEKTFIAHKQKEFFDKDTSEGRVPQKQAPDGKMVPQTVDDYVVAPSYIAANLKDYERDEDFKSKKTAIIDKHCENELARFTKAASVSSPRSAVFMKEFDEAKDAPWLEKCAKEVVPNATLYTMYDDLKATMAKDPKNPSFTPEQELFMNRHADSKNAIPCSEYSSYIQEYHNMDKKRFAELGEKFTDRLQMLKGESSKVENRLLDDLQNIHDSPVHKSLATKDKQDLVMIMSYLKKKPEFFTKEIMEEIKTGIVNKLKVNAVTYDASGALGAIKTIKEKIDLAEGKAVSPSTPSSSVSSSSISSALSQSEIAKLGKMLQAKGFVAQDDKGNKTVSPKAGGKKSPSITGL